MRQTWEGFNATYGPYLAAEIKRLSEREKLRTAIIEKSLIAAIIAIGGFVLVAVWQYMQDSLIERNRRSIDHNTKAIEQMKDGK